MRYHLGVKFVNPEFKAETIVLMGGGGYPSNSVLMRMHYTSELAHKYPDAKNNCCRFQAKSIIEQVPYFKLQTI